MHTIRLAVLVTDPIMSYHTTYNTFLLTYASRVRIMFKIVVRSFILRMFFLQHLNLHLWVESFFKFFYTSGNDMSFFLLFCFVFQGASWRTAAGSSGFQNETTYGISLLIWTLLKAEADDEPEDEDEDDGEDEDEAQDEAESETEVEARLADR